MVSKKTGAGKRGLDCGLGAGQTVREWLAGDFLFLWLVACSPWASGGWLAVL
jgi:hypothetical protein